MATDVAFFSPCAPIIRIYIQEIGKIEAEPKLAADTGPTFDSPGCPDCLDCASGFPGKKSAKCFLTITGPTPGPPPPCGIQKVLCKFKCETSAPNLPGFERPTNAFKLAPST